MESIVLSDEIIEHVKKRVPLLVMNKFQNDLKKVILYGSCARGDYTEDSDIDIALITESSGGTGSYNSVLAEISTQIAMETYAVVNFVCLNAEDYDDKKSWYPYYKSIDREGVVLFDERRIYGVGKSKAGKCEGMLKRGGNIAVR